MATLARPQFLLNLNSEMETTDGCESGSLPVVSRAGPGKNLPGGRSLNSTGKLPIPLPGPKPASEFGINNDINWIDHRAGGDDQNGFAGVRQLSAGWQRRPIPQSLGIVQGGCILGVALKNVLKFFKGLIKLSLFV